VFFLCIGVIILGAGIKQAYAVKDISIDGAGGVHDRAQYSNIGMTKMGFS